MTLTEATSRAGCCPPALAGDPLRWEEGRWRSSRWSRLYAGSSDHVGDLEVRDGGSGAGQKGEVKEKVKHCHFDLLTLELKQRNGDVEL